MRSERQRINAAIDVLETHAEQIEEQLGEARRNAIMARQGSEISLDVRAHTSYKREVEEAFRIANLFCDNHRRL